MLAQNNTAVVMQSFAWDQAEIQVTQAAAPTRIEVTRSGWRIIGQYENNQLQKLTIRKDQGTE